jgi:hypothetical protein
MLNYSVSIKYMLTGYVFFIGILMVYLISLFVRWRNLRRDFLMLKEIQKKDSK